MPRQLPRPDASAPTAEVDTGSASSRGRPPERIWLVRLRRNDNSVIVAIGLHRVAAEHLAARINDLLAPTTSAMRAAIDSSPQIMMRNDNDMKSFSIRG